MMYDREQCKLLASLYVAGAMPQDECEAFTQHLSECEACQLEVQSFDGVVEQLLGNVDPIEGDPGERETLLERVHADANGGDNPQVWKQWDEQDSSQDLLIHRDRDASWEEIGIPGIRVQRLFVDRARDQITMRVQMDPGSAYPPHRHGGPEECFVVKGELIVDEMVLTAGDYQRCDGGSRHPVQRTETGCELLIVSSLSDELE